MEPAPALAKLSAARPPRWRWRADDCIHDLRWAAHGHTLAVAALSGELAVLDGATGKPRWRVADAHPGGALWCAFHPTEAIVASGGQDGAAKLWDANTGAPLRTLFQDRKRWVEHGGWSADGAFLATAAGKGVTFWNAAGEACGAIAEQKGTVSALAWHPRLAHVLIGSFGGVSVWEPGKTEALSRAEWPTSILAVAWRPDGEWIAAGTGDASVQTWRVGTEETLRMGGYATKVRELAWHPGGDHLSTGGGFNLVCWDFRGEGPSGSTPQEWMGHSEFVTALAADPGDPTRVASAGKDQLVFLWKLGSDDPVSLRAIPESGPVLLAWQPGGKKGEKETALAVGCEGGEVVLFKIAA